MDYEKRMSEDEELAEATKLPDESFLTDAENTLQPKSWVRYAELVRNPEGVTPEDAKLLVTMIHQLKDTVDYARLEIDDLNNYLNNLDLNESEK